MRLGDKQIGSPQILYKNTKASIEAITTVEEGAIAYATDTKQHGTYNGSIWSWVSSSYIPNDGWIVGAGTWSYSSADSPSFVISINQDVTTLIGVGYRIKLIQTSSKYFIVTNVGAFGGGATLITVYGGTDYILANAAITSPSYSPIKAPLGFPLNHAKWSITVTDTQNCTKSSPSASTWYGGSGLSPTGPSIDIHTGSWEVYYKASLDEVATTAGVGAKITLSTANNSESDANNSVGVTMPLVGTNRMPITYKTPITVTSKTTHYLNIFTGAAGQTSISLRGDNVPTVIRAVCGYL